MPHMQLLKVSLCNSDAKILMEPGATASFVTFVFECKLNVTSCLQLPVLAVSTPLDDIVLANKVYKCSSVIMEGWELLVNLIALS